MRKKSDKTADPPWELSPVVDWLMDEGRFLPDLNDVVCQLGDRMLAAGAPLWRLRLSMRTLHPLVTAVTAMWEREEGRIETIESLHGLEGRSGYVGSPLAIIDQTGKAFRKRLTTTLSDSDHSVLHELKARGGTDYFGIPMRFLHAPPAILVLTTDVAEGFSDLDIRSFTRLASIFSPIVEVFSSMRVSTTVAEAYVGPRTGRRVLDGQITRGHIEKIDAAILVSDIRDWTGLNARVSAEKAVALANRYFEIIAEAIEANGGEILKFVGDGVLAIFPRDNNALDASTTCERALAAAQHALQVALTTKPPLTLTFGIGMHFGEVLYGNIGSKTRIDFTVLGQAVNLAARIEGLCGKFDIPVLFSQDFADRLTEPTRLVAEEFLKGHDAKSRVYTTSEDVRKAR